MSTERTIINYDREMQRASIKIPGYAKRIEGTTDQYTGQCQVERDLDAGFIYYKVTAQVVVRVPITTEST